LARRLVSEETFQKVLAQSRVRVQEDGPVGPGQSKCRRGENANLPGGEDHIDGIHVPVTRYLLHEKDNIGHIERSSGCFGQCQFGGSKGLANRQSDDGGVIGRDGARVGLHLRVECLCAPQSSVVVTQERGDLDRRTPQHQRV
jgi:hypothetical protein